MAMFGERSAKLMALWGADAPRQETAADPAPSAAGSPIAEKSLFRLTAELKNLLHRSIALRPKAATEAGPEADRDAEDPPETKNAAVANSGIRGNEYLPITPERQTANRVAHDAWKERSHGKSAQ